MPFLENFRILVFPGCQVPVSSAIDGDTHALKLHVWNRAIVTNRLCQVPGWADNTPMIRETLFELGTHTFIETPVTRRYLCATSVNTRTGNYDLMPDHDINIGLGFCADIPVGFAGLIIPNFDTVSGLRLLQMNSAVPIDPGFAGELVVTVKNFGEVSYPISSQVSLFNLVVIPIALIPTAFKVVTDPIEFGRGKRTTASKFVVGAST